MKESKAKAFSSAAYRRFIRCAQWPIETSIRSLLWLGDKKRAFPEFFAHILKPGISIAAGTVLTVIGLKPTNAPEFWKNWGLESHVSYSTFHTIVQAGLESGLILIVINGVLPLLIYIPHAVAMRSMGLIEAKASGSGRRKLVLSCLTRYLKYHNDNEPIRVICISGHDLITRYENGYSAPLKPYAEKGLLHVLFPSSDPHNPTISARYATYKPEYRRSNYPAIEKLIQEIDFTKALLREHKDNRIFEHHELCMWRVILLSDHCIVQNYFPNHSGCQSDTSPIFVFEKAVDCAYSYYGTFDQMFKLLSEVQQAPAPEH